MAGDRRSASAAGRSVSRYLLDTNIVSSLMRRPPETLLLRLEEAGSDAVYTSIVVAAELRFGASWKRSARLTQEVEGMLERLEVVSLQVPADLIYGNVRADLARQGQIIGRNDLWIAAQALQDGSVLVTDNVKEFGRVPGLKLENWLRS